jgi:hypothetical protein
MATLYKHGPIIGIYRLRGDRVALFANGTVLRNRRLSVNRWGGWRSSAFNAQRLLAGGLLTLDDTAAGLAIKSRAAVDSHVHEGTKRRRAIERR